MLLTSCQMDRCRSLNPVLFSLRFRAVFVILCIGNISDKTGFWSFGLEMTRIVIMHKYYY